MVNSTDVQTILDADLLCLIRKYRITKVRSRQRVEPAAVQPIVMLTPALGRLGIISKSTVINLNYGVTNV